MIKTTSFELAQELDDWLRIEAAKRDTSKGKLIVRLCEIGRLVLESGAENLAQFCSEQRGETLDNWTGDDE